MSIEAAFRSICTEAKEAVGGFVSLYTSVPYYGGPEEGGWWGSDTHLVSYQWFPTQEQAEAAKEAVQALAQELTDIARKDFGDRCLKEVEFLEAKGLDADYLPEVDGEETYWVTVEETKGSLVSHGSRQYS